MLKKVVLGILLIGFIGILVWGGVNRTMAKTNDAGGGNANNQSVEQVVNDEGVGNQQHSYGNSENQATEECDEVGLYGNNNGQTDTAAQGQSHGNGFQSDAAKENGAASSGGNGNGAGQGGGYDPLTASEIEALHMALDDEYHALAVYQSVIATFGEVEPFVEIAASEQHHIEALVNQFNKHELPVPENPWIGNVPAFDSLQQACQAGVDAEIANADLYNQLFSMTDDPGLTRVFTNLSSASLNSHLPQFEACQ